MDVSRLEAELSALRRAQRVFADSHPSMDIQGKLHDLQELYIGDLLVKECQISQYKSQIENLASEKAFSRGTTAVSTPVANPANSSSILAARVQSLQKALSEERQRRAEAEAKIEETTSKLSTAHRAEVAQLKTRMHSLQDTNKKLQERISSFETLKKQSMQSTSSDLVDISRGTTPRIPGTPTMGSSPTNSVVSSSDKVPYVKYAQLRSEKRQMEAKLTSQIEELKLEKVSLVSERTAELERQKEHTRRVIADLERKVKLAESNRSDEKSEVRDLRTQLESAMAENESITARVSELSSRCSQLTNDLNQRQYELDELVNSEKYLATEIEEKDRVIAELSRDVTSHEDVERLKTERMDLLERIEEREDMLKQLQDESGEQKNSLSDLAGRLEEKEREITVMIEQAEELDALLSKADSEMKSNRDRIQSLESENKRLLSELARLDDLMKAVTLNSEQVSANFKSQQSMEQGRIQSLLEEKEKLTERIEQLAEELEKLRSTTQRPKQNESLDSTEEGIAGGGPTPPLSGNVLKAENMFHDAVDLCAEGAFSEAVALLEQASASLSRLSKSEIAANDPETLKILESDIYGQLGVAFQSLSQVPEAIEAYTTAVDVDPQAHACHANLAVLLHHQSRQKEAESHAKQAVQLAPEIDEYTTLLEQVKAGVEKKFRNSTRW
jgi:tetratricopeptide (TPR) repeat protein